MKVILVIVIVATITSEAFLLYQNYSLKQKIKSFNQLENELVGFKAKYGKTINESALEGQSLPILPEHSENDKSNGVYTLKYSRYLVVLYFSIGGCSSCLESEISIWNERFASYNENLCQVIGITNKTQFGDLHSIIQALNINFPVYEVNDMQLRLSEAGIPITPAILFADTQSQRTIYAQLSTPNDLSDQGFIDKVQIILDSSKN